MSNQNNIFKYIGQLYVDDDCCDRSVHQFEGRFGLDNDGTPCSERELVVRVKTLIGTDEAEVSLSINYPNRNKEKEIGVIEICEGNSGAVTELLYPVIRARNISILEPR